MFCNNCHANLDKFSAVIDMMPKCPICGGDLKKPEKEVPQLSFESFCVKLIKEFSKDVFATEESLLQKVFEDKSPEYVNARDKFSMLTIKRIPSLIYNAANFPEEEQVEVLNKCQRLLCFDLGIAFDPCKEMLDVLQKALWKNVLPINQYFVGDSFKDPRDGQVYKTVRIGDQVWMAENLKYKCVGESDGLYKGDAANTYCAVKGWRVPTKKDFEKLISFATNAGFGDASSVLMSKEGWKKQNVTPTDNFGFSAKPTNAKSESFFWGTISKCGSGCFNDVLCVSAGKISIGEYSNADYDNVWCAVRLIKDDQPIPSKNQK